MVKVGGRYLALKGPDTTEEIAQSRRAMTELGAELEAGELYEIPGTDIKHSVLVVKKTKNTPEKYPRRFAKIQKSPL